ncbi:WXG100 family type VII secretion target [Nocardia sp. CDC159]|uniref:WXG100 family type VII secretion target n=1 Tax=Nocardia pulmonis TaxID=2951408 RepID=A0A9X2E8H0_9NOCA|nr:MULTISPECIES: WXG100 family type VII secretion target [Nocardia]MCM6776087.1 WXG100 family type VII secretion target [Nocardia pulmonis]MCM6788586.1 WXG100 family type VII secretion target [Nocardia sp. CDC159]
MADEPWRDLRNRALNGSYRIRVPEGIIQSAATYVGDAITVIDTAASDKNRSGSYGSMTNFTAGTDRGQAGLFFGNLPSGRLLANAYTDIAAKLLNEIIPAYKKALADMGEALVAGGRVMANADGSAADKFNRIKRDSAGTTTMQDKIRQVERNRRYLETEGVYRGQWRDDNGRLPDWANNADRKRPLQLEPRFKPGDKGTTTVKISPEPPDYLDYARALSLGQSLSGKPVFLAEMGNAWLRMASGIQTAFSDLDNNIESLKKLGWEGQGADAATGAINRLSGHGRQLAQTMNTIGNNLVNGSGWTAVVVYNMPTKDKPTPEEENAWTRQANDAFNNWYLPGVGISGVIPDLVPPTGIQGVSGDPGDRGGGKDTGGGGKDGSGSGSGSGGGGGGGGGAGKGQPRKEFSPDQKRLEEQARKEKERLEREARERDAENRKRLEDYYKRQEEAQKQAERRAQQQAAQQATQQAMQQAQQALQQGLQAAQQAAQQGLQEAQKGLAAGMPPLSSLAGLAESARDAAKSGKGGGGAGGGGAGKGGGGAGAAGGPQSVLQASRLFPRASVTGAAETAVGTGRAGIAAGGAPMGAPGMGPAGAGAGAGQGAKERKRAEFLDSTEHLDEALGTPPVVAKPVVEK